MNIRAVLHGGALSLALGLGGLASSPVAATREVEASTEVPVPRADEAWRRIKFPWLCPTTTAVESRTVGPAVGSVEAWRRIKFPWLYPTTTTALAAPAPGPSIGSQEAWRRMKFPWLYPPRPVEAEQR
jgi:hypothetical protein